MLVLPKGFKVIGLNYKLPIYESGRYTVSDSNVPDGLWRGATLTFPASGNYSEEPVKEVHSNFQVSCWNPLGAKKVPDTGTIAYLKSIITNHDDQEILVRPNITSDVSGYPIYLKDGTTFVAGYQLPPWKAPSIYLRTGHIELLHTAGLSDGATWAPGKYSEGRFENGIFGYSQFESSILPKTDFVFQGIEASAANFVTEAGVTNSSYTQIESSINNIFIAPFFDVIDNIEQSRGKVLWPHNIHILKPRQVASAAFTEGNGGSGARPWTNDLLLRCEARASNTWVGPASDNVAELYYVDYAQDLESGIDGVSIEVLCRTDYEPIVGDFKFILYRDSETEEISFADTDIGLITYRSVSDENYIVNIYLRDDPFTDTRWEKEDIDETLFGISIPSGVASVSRIGFSAFSVMVCESRLSLANSGLVDTIPEYTDYNPSTLTSKLTSGDEALVASPTSTQVFLDVRRPTKIATANITSNSENLLYDSSLEDFDPDDTESPWKSGGGAMAIHSSVDWPYDGDYCVAVYNGGSLYQEIDIDPSWVGDSWKLGGVVAVRGGNGTIGFSVTFTLSVGSDVTYTTTMNTANLIPNLWYKRFSSAFVVPENALSALVSVIWTDTTERWAFFDCIVLGPSSVTIEDAIIEPFILEDGEVYLPVSEFTYGSWDVLKVGQTVVAGDYKLRLVEILEDSGFIKVAEDNVQWTSITSVDIYDTHEYWLRYQRLVDTGAQKDPSSEQTAREAVIVATEVIVAGT